MYVYVCIYIVHESNAQIRRSIAETPEVEHFLRTESAISILKKVSDTINKGHNYDLLKNITYQWRKYTRLQIKIREYTKVKRLQRNARVLTKALWRWLHAYHIQIKGNKVKKWRQHTILYTSFDLWCMQYRHVILIHKYIHYKYTRKGRQFFKFWRDLVRLKRSDRKRGVIDITRILSPSRTLAPYPSNTAFTTTSTSPHFLANTVAQSAQSLFEMRFVRLIKRRVFNAIRRSSRRTMQVCIHTYRMHSIPYLVKCSICCDDM